MGAVGGVAILGGNFEAATFPEDKVVQRSLTAGTQESSPIDAIILDALPLGAPGQLDSHATIWKGHSNDGSPHTIDWKLFVDVTANDGTGSLWTLQTRIDAAPYGTVLTIDDNGLLTVSGATFTMDQLIIDSDNTEAVLIRKDGDAGDVFIVDTVNDVVRLGSDTTTFTFGASSDVILERVSARVLQMNSDPGADSDNELRIVANDDSGVERYIQLLANGLNQARVAALRADGGARFDLELFTTSGSVEIWTDGVQRWTFGAGSGGFDFEIEPFITNRYDIGNTVKAVRDVFTNRVFLGQDQTAAYDAITIDGTDLAAPGQQDSGAIILTGLSNDGSAHDIDWKQFVNVTANDGTGSIFTIQSRIDAVAFVDEFTITSTTSPTLVTIGPGSTGAALAFGPLGSDGPATTGTIRLKNLDTIVIRNAGDDDDHFILESLNSDEYNMFDPLIGRVDFLEANTRFFKRVTVHQDGNSTAALVVGGAGIFIVDTTNRLIRLAQDDAVLTWGTASDVQLHRDAADILAQRRGLNPQEWRLYERFVSLSDYDRLVFYIGGGPSLITAEIEAQSTVANQPIDLVLKSLWDGSSQGQVKLQAGSNILQLRGNSAGFIATPTGTFDFSGLNRFTANDLRLGRLLTTAADSIIIDIANPTGLGDFEDSHKIVQIGRARETPGGGQRAAQWNHFVDVLDAVATSQ